MSWVIAGWPALPIIIFNYIRVGKANINADALLRVSWPGCVPDTLGTYHQFTAVVVQAMQEATLEGPLSPIETYRLWHACPLPSRDGLQVTCMTTNNWQ